MAYSRKPQLASAECYSEARPPFFRVDYGARRDCNVEAISKINPTFLFPPGWHSFSPSHYIRYFASITSWYKAMAGSRAAQ